MAVHQDDYFCETCDRSWKTQEKLDEHVAEHQVCGRDGCTFTAHPKVILKHVQLQHDSGLYHRIVFTENPADVAKWIAERKSRFPTKENIEKKEAQTSEMIERGERIPSQGKRFHSRGRFGNRGDRRRKGDANHIKPEAGPKQRKPNVKISKAVDIEVKWKDPDSWRGDLPQFPGTAAFPHSEDSTDKLSTEERHFSDDDEWVENKREMNIEKPTVSNVLSSLMLSYGSDMSDNDECVDTNPQSSEPPVVSTEKTIETVPIEKMEESCPGPKPNNHSVDEFIAATNKEDSDSGPEESAFEREDKLNIPIPSLKKECETKLMKSLEPSNKLISGPKTPVVKPHLKRHQLSLLEKLLRNEIRHERNVILQCVRYVVQNNFFSCESTENNIKCS